MRATVHAVARSSASACWSSRRCAAGLDLVGIARKILQVARRLRIEIGNARGVGIGRCGIARLAQQLGGKVLAVGPGCIAGLSVNGSRACEGDERGKEVGEGFAAHGRSSLESWRRWRRASSAPGPLPEREGLENFAHADIAGDAVVRRHLAGAIEPVAWAELGAQHDEARRGLDVERAEQPRIDAERTGRVAACSRSAASALLERLAVSLREAAQHGDAARLGHVVDQRLQRLGRHRQAGKGDEARGSPRARPSRRRLAPRSSRRSRERRLSRLRSMLSA